MYKVIINNENGADKILVFNAKINVTNELFKSDPYNDIFKMSEESFERL